MLKAEDDSTKKDKGTSKITSETLQAFGADLADMLQEEGADYQQCVKEAAEIYLGLEDESQLDEMEDRDKGPDTIMMFKDCGGPNLHC